MAGGVDVNIGADTREFATSVKSGMQDPVEDAQKALDDYVDTAKSSGTTLEQTFTGQQRATEDLRSDLDKLNDTIRDGTRSSTSSAKSDYQGFKREASEGLDEVKESAKSNAIQVGASFTGGFDQAAGGLQGFLAEFLAGFGPAGVVAGIAAAAGIGLITSQVDAGTEAAEQQKEAIASLAGEYIELGKKGQRAGSDVADSLKAMATSTDGSDVIITLQKAWDAAHTSGADYQQVVEAIASGSVQQIQSAERAVDRLDSAHASLTRTTTDYAGRIVSTNVDQIKSNEQLQTALKQAEKQADAAGKAEELAAKAGLSQLQLKADLVTQVEKSYDDAAGSVDTYIKGEKKVFDTGAYIKAMRDRQKALEKYHDEVAKTDLSPAALKFIESQGADQAAAMLRGYQKASPAHQAELDKIWTTAGTENATTYQDAIGKSLKGQTFTAPKITKPVVPLADTAAIDRQLAQSRSLRITVEAYTRDGKRIG